MNPVPPEPPNRPTGAEVDPAAPAPGRVPPRLSSRDLFDGAHEVTIDHEGVVYRLKRTALGKLILTK